VSPAPTRIAAVCFDLDDTLYPQAAWLEGAWAAVAARAADEGIDAIAMRAALVLVAAQGGTDGGRIIDQALERIGATGVAVAPLVEAFRNHDARSLEPFSGVRDALTELAARVPLGLVSDGDPDIQRSKLTALGLGAALSVVVWSDEHGRAHRKPDPLPFQLAVELLGVEAAETVYVGDRPEKDVAGAVAAGLSAIRVRTGEWSAEPDDPRAWISVPTAVDAIRVIDGARRAHAGSTPTSTRNSNSPGASR
jgi:putative hydrolase of the HAD superfamily